MDSNEHTIPEKSLGGKRLPFETLRYVSENAARNHQFIPLGVVDGVLEIGMVDPTDLEAKDVIQFIASTAGLPLKIYKISAQDYEEGIKSYEGLGGEVDQALDEFETEQGDQGEAELIETKKDEKTGANIIEEAPVTKIVGVLLQHATTGNASDIHIEPGRDRVRVRFRVDGILYTSLFLPSAVHDAVISRIKILTNMKLDQKRKPQDGRFSAKIEGRQIDFRVSTFPTYFGEKAVLRILDPDKKLINLSTLGFNTKTLTTAEESIKKPHGLILITGPTGSGKTTTLYSMLNQVDKEKRNAVSLEDPIEYDIPGINQSQVRPEIDYTFASGLRSILRQDPDIIMVGEIRDAETAKLAIQASLTGHLVFSTLHTNTAAGAIPRLLDMGVDRYLIPPTLVMVVGQRLVPLLSENGKKPVPMSESIRQMVDKQFEDLPEEYRQEIVIPDQVYEAQASGGSPSGTKGRIGVFEIITMNNQLEHLVLEGAGEDDIYQAVRAKGFITMKEDALLKAFEGLIPFEEVNKL
ncbi:MAG: GspE/PulE family protein [Patescibacteria group bacterium]